MLCRVEKGTEKLWRKFQVFLGMWQCFHQGTWNILSKKWCKAAAGDSIFRKGAYELTLEDSNLIFTFVLFYYSYIFNHNDCI